MPPRPVAAARRLAAVACALLFGCATSGAAHSTADKAAPTPQSRGPAESIPELPDARECAGPPLLSIAEVARSLHQGQRVAVDGVPRATILCTQRLCRDAAGNPPPEGCCNTCQGSYELSGDGVRIALRGAGQCSGMDCALRCDPFGTAPTHSYRFAGVVASSPEKGSAAVIDLNVEKVCRAP